MKGTWFRSIRSPEGAAVPTYDYQCQGCNTVYELRESFSAPMEHVCEQCGKATAKRLLSAPTIVFKGTGWYATDSRSKRDSSSSSSDASPSTAEGAAASENSSKSESKSESKPESKSPAS